MQSARNKSPEQHVRHGLAAVVALTLAIAAAWQAGFTRLAAHSAMNAAVICTSSSSEDVSPDRVSAAPCLCDDAASGVSAGPQIPATVKHACASIELLIAVKSGTIALPPPATLIA